MGNMFLHVCVFVRERVREGRDIERVVVSSKDVGFPKQWDRVKPRNIGQEAPRFPCCITILTHKHTHTRAHMRKCVATTHYIRVCEWSGKCFSLSTCRSVYKTHRVYVCVWRGAEGGTTR